MSRYLFLFGMTVLVLVTNAGPLLSQGNYPKAVASHVFGEFLERFVKVSVDEAQEAAMTRIAREVAESRVRKLGTSQFDEAGEALFRALPGLDEKSVSKFRQLSRADRELTIGLCEEIAKIQRKYGPKAGNLIQKLGTEGLEHSKHHGPIVFEGAQKLLDPDSVSVLCRETLSPAQASKLKSMLSGELQTHLKPDQIAPLWNHRLRIQETNQVATFMKTTLDKHWGKMLLGGAVVAYLVCPEKCSELIRGGSKGVFDAAGKIVENVVDGGLRSVTNAIPADFSEAPIRAILKWGLITFIAIMAVRLGWCWGRFLLYPPPRVPPQHQMPVYPFPPMPPRQ